MRKEFEIIKSLIPKESHVLDLGCGSGILLKALKEEKQVHGYGLEIAPAKISQCIANGVNVIEQNLDHGLGNFADNSFDVVVMTQALQAVRAPDQLLDEMLRIGRQGIITFPNFGHWGTRSYLFLRGRMPKSKALPYEWYNTPNIHLCTLRDFENLCRSMGLRILERSVLDNDHEGHWSMRWLPNLLGQLAIYQISK